MKNGLKQISNAKSFIITSLIFVLIGGLLLMTQDKIEIHLSINEKHNLFLDYFFSFWTHLGDGLFTFAAVVIIGLFAFKTYRYSTFALGISTLVLAGALSQLLKRVVFDDALRPKELIGAEKLYFVPGIDVHSLLSFPSGHAAAGFAFMGFVACLFFSKNKFAQLLLAITAVLIGYSRMYLSQHFLEDVVAGAILGILSFSIAFFVKGTFQKK